MLLALSLLFKQGGIGDAKGRQSQNDECARAGQVRYLGCAQGPGAPAGMADQVKLVAALEACEAQTA
jgi:hypothetical protein